MTKKQLHISGLPEGLAAADQMLFRTRVLHAAQELLDQTALDRLAVSIHTQDAIPSRAEPCGPSNHNNAGAGQSEATEYRALDPLFSWDRVVLNAEVRERIITAVETIEYKAKLFEEWGLSEIEPFPRAALNFHGPPGTGKTMAAHAVAHMLRRQIIIASYAQIESKYLGDAPKNAERIFQAAEQAEAVLFIDEADSLLSRRLTGASQGSERAANSLTSQLLICLEWFSGVVIFATNLLENYDRAFDTRVQHVEFTLPDENARRGIWRNHLPARLPLADDVGLDELASLDGLCGRDIRNTVIMAATQAVRNGGACVNRRQLLDAAEIVLQSRRTPADDTNGKLTRDERQRLQNRLRNMAGDENGRVH